MSNLIAENFMLKGIISELPDEVKFRYEECLKQVQTIRDTYQDVFPMVLATIGIELSSD